MVVDAVVRAIDRRGEVFQVIEDSEDANERQSVGLVSWWVWTNSGAGWSWTRSLEGSRETSVRPSLPRQRASDQSCRMAAEEFVPSVGCCLSQRQATKKRLVTVVPAPFHDSGFAVSFPVPAVSRAPCSCLLEL